MFIGDPVDRFKALVYLVAIVFPDDVQGDADENQTADPEQTNRTLIAESIPHSIAKVGAVSSD